MTEAAGIEQYEPYDNFANNHVHGGSKGSQYQLGIPDNIVALGPSAEGLIDPAQMTVLMLYRVVDAFLSLDEQPYWRISSKALENLSGDVIRAFVAVPLLSHVSNNMDEVFEEALESVEF